MQRRVLIYPVMVVLFAVLCAFGIQDGPTAGKEEIKWTDWNSGYPTAIKGGKIGLVDVYTSWCGWCKKMDRDTYANEAVISKVKKSFIPIKFNPEEDKTYYVFMGNDTIACSGPQLLSMLSNGQPGGYPTTFFIVQKQNITQVRKYPGYYNAAQFETVLDSMIAFSKR